MELKKIFLIVHCKCTEIQLLLCTDLIFCNLLILLYSSNFLVDSLGFCMYKIISFVNRDSFISFFPICMPFISFPYIIALACHINVILLISGI